MEYIVGLITPPFEPIHYIELKFLTLKTIFVVTLASGRCRSEIHALCYDSHDFRQNQDQSVLRLYPDPDFVTKSQSLGTVAEPVKIKAFIVVGVHDFVRRLCPVRSLQEIHVSFSVPTRSQEAIHFLQTLPYWRNREGYYFFLDS